eukprot:7666204-Karenia_brevis.AAC.1
MARKKTDEDCAQIIQRICARGDAPMIFSVDLNQDVNGIPVLQHAIRMGIIIDAAHAWAHIHGNEPPPTYFGSTVDSNFDPKYGPNRTRIDYIFANHIFWSAMTSFQRRPDLAIEKHVPHMLT